MSVKTNCCSLCGYHILPVHRGRRKYYCARCGLNRHVDLLKDCDDDGTTQEVFK